MSTTQKKRKILRSVTIKNQAQIRIISRPDTEIANTVDLSWDYKDENAEQISSLLEQSGFKDWVEKLAKPHAEANKPTLSVRAAGAWWTECPIEVAECVADILEIFLNQKLT